MTFIFSVILFCLGGTIGFLIHFLLSRMSDGSIIVTVDENGSKKFLLDFEDFDPYFLDDRSSVTLRVTKEVKEKPPMPKPPKKSQQKHIL